MTEAVHRTDWTLAELLEAHREALQNELHTAMPGRVESYDAAEQVADVTPMLRRALTTEAGEVAHETLPTLRRVRVIQQRAHEGGWHIHMPLAAGDTVLLLVCERDISRWLQTGEVSPTPDTRLHHLSHAVALPGFYPSARRLSSPPTDAMVVGKEGGARVELKTDGTVVIYGDAIKLGSDGTTKHVAFAEDVASEFNTVKASLDTLSGGSSTPAEFLTPYAGPTGSLGSSKVEVE